MGYLNYSMHFPDPKLLQRIKAAAKAQDVSVSEFLRDAAERSVEAHEKRAAKRPKTLKQKAAA